MKPNLTWTKADTRRAEKMGWLLVPEETLEGVSHRIAAHIDSIRHGYLKSDSDAVEMVVAMVAAGCGVLPANRYETACKAVLICCGGAR